MLGDDLRQWFELFHGIIIYRPRPDGRHTADGWINWQDIENRFKSEHLRFAGKPYDANDDQQRNALLNAISEYGAALVKCRLLERRRQISPPSLDYRVTRLGRRVGNWDDGRRLSVKKRAVFFIAALGFRFYKFRNLLAFGAFGWVVLNAAKFYGALFSWLEELPFAAWSAALIAFALALWVIIISTFTTRD